MVEIARLSTPRTERTVVNQFSRVAPQKTFICARCVSTTLLFTSCAFHNATSESRVRQASTTKMVTLDKSVACLVFFISFLWPS